MVEREEALTEASKTPLVDLLRKIIFGDYTPGIEDEVLIARVKGLQEKE
jgi:hypothetical protein